MSNTAEPAVKQARRQSLHGYSKRSGEPLTRSQGYFTRSDAAACGTGILASQNPVEVVRLDRS